MRRLQPSRLAGPAIALAAAIVPIVPIGAAAAGPGRTILQHADLPAGPPQSATMGTVAMNPGDALPWHTHPGIEIGYVVSGEVVISVAGMPDRTFHAGQSFIVPRGKAHRSTATGSGETRMVVTWVTDTGAALSAPATAPAQ